MKCSENDISKHMQNYVGIICLLSNKRNILVCWALVATGEQNIVGVCTSAIHGEKPSLVLGQTLKCV